MHRRKTILLIVSGLVSLVVFPLTTYAIMSNLSIQNVSFYVRGICTVISPDNASAKISFLAVVETSGYLETQLLRPKFDLVVQLGPEETGGMTYPGQVNFGTDVPSYGISSSDNLLFHHYSQTRYRLEFVRNDSQAAGILLGKKLV